MGGGGGTAVRAPLRNWVSVPWLLPPAVTPPLLPPAAVTAVGTGVRALSSTPTTVDASMPLTAPDDDAAPTNGCAVRAGGAVAGRCDGCDGCDCRSPNVRDAPTAAAEERRPAGRVCWERGRGPIANECFRALAKFAEATSSAGASMPGGRFVAGSFLVAGLRAGGGDTAFEAGSAGAEVVAEAGAGAAAVVAEARVGGAAVAGVGVGWVVGEAAAAAPPAAEALTGRGRVGDCAGGQQQQQ